MHKAVLDLQYAMEKCKKDWGEYFVLKMDDSKCLQSVDRETLKIFIIKKIKVKTYWKKCYIISVTSYMGLNNTLWVIFYEYL